MKRLLAAIAASSISCAGLDLFTSMILSRLLGPAAVGELSLITNFSTLFGVVGTFGFVQANIIYFSKENKGKQSLRAFLKLFFCSILFLWGLLYTLNLSLNLKYNVADLLNSNEKLTALLYVSLHLLVVYLSSFLLAFRQYKNYALANVMYSAIVFIFITVNYITNTVTIDLTKSLLVFVIGKSFIIFWVIFVLAKNIEMFKVMNNQEESFDYSVSRGYYYYNCIQQIVNFAPIFTLSFYFNDYESLGYFSRALSITLLLTLVPLSIGPHLFSLWANSKNNQAEQLFKVVSVFLLIIFIIVPTIFIFSKDIIVLFYGKSFESAGELLRALLFSAALRILYDPIMNAISSMNGYYVNFIIMLISLIVFFCTLTFQDSKYHTFSIIYSLIASNFSILILCLFYYLYNIRSYKNDK